MATVAVQNYITAILGFLVIEMIMTWGFFGMHFASVTDVQDDMLT